MAEGRRGLLKKTLGGAALLVAAGTVPLALRGTRLRPTPVGRKLQFFTPAEYSIWAAVADRVLAREATYVTQEHSNAAPFPAAEHVEKAAGIAAPPAPGELDVAPRADAFLTPLPKSDARELKQLLASF